MQVLAAHTAFENREIAFRYGRRLRGTINQRTANAGCGRRIAQPTVST
jgi:hypothetical protein